MPTPDQSRIEADRARPRIMDLWWALCPLTSVVRFMQTGAHPDDEVSGMLAALAFREGINLSYACSTRGEGGQNDIGTESGAALGALRTREMERACDILGMRMYWHSETPEDPITDFGFSKSGEETLDRWGDVRTLARFVDILRTEKPDIICPTFLDVPGQHGHHRAITQATHKVMEAAADPAFPSNLAPWQVKKMYLPAWSGAGQAYDDDLPPPPATLTIDGQGVEPTSGWSWERIGQQSRAFHRTQGMGRWVAADVSRDWPLHLVKSHLPVPDGTLAAGLPSTLADLAALDGAEAISGDLRAAQAAIDTAIADFPRATAVAAAAMQALKAIRSARAKCPEALYGEVLHRLDAKDVQLGHVVRIALGVEVRCRVAADFVLPGQTVGLSLEASPGEATDVDVSFDVPEGWTITDGALQVGGDVPATDAYRSSYDPRAPAAPACIADIRFGEDKLSVRVPFETPPVIVPKRMAEVTPDATVLNLTTAARSLQCQVSGLHPAGSTCSAAPPDGWQASVSNGVLSITAPEDLSPGLNVVPVLVDGAPAETTKRIVHPHTDPTAVSHPASLRVLALNADIPATKVGYIGAGNDRVGHWLSAMGATVTDLSEADLSDQAVLAPIDTIVIGILAMRFRAGLAQAMPRIHDWARAGGTLVTLYHRPWDNWDPDAIPPHRLEIGQPSLRWRVTDETADVRQLADHPILTTPNRIEPADWAGWIKERGLYFAKSWDAAYTPLLEMADPGEEPLHGSLLVANVGAGRHIHTSLNLHHQMENLVPGAFRLMANFIASRG